MPPSGMLAIAKKAVTAKSTRTNPLEHPICRILWHATCKRQPHAFEYMLWTWWALMLAIWVVIFVLLVHCGAGRRGPTRTRCIIDGYCPCWAEARRQRAAQSPPRGLALHALSTNDLRKEAMKVGFSHSELEEHQQLTRGSPKESLVQLILGNRLPGRGRRTTEPDDELETGDKQRPLHGASSPAAPDDY